MTATTLVADQWSGVKEQCKRSCLLLADRLFGIGEGEAALCALMASVDAGIPRSFGTVLPQLSFGAEHLWYCTASLATDELDVIARAWSRAGPSIRKLQAIVSPTLDARDQTAVRH